MSTPTSKRLTELCGRIHLPIMPRDVVDLVRRDEIAEVLLAVPELLRQRDALAEAARDMIAEFSPWTKDLDVFLSDTFLSALEDLRAALADCEG